MNDQENYRELAKEINQLRIDVSRSAHASKFTASANKAAIEEEKQHRADLEQRLRMLETNKPVIEHRLDDLEKSRKEHTGKIHTIELEDAKDENKIRLKASETTLSGKRWAVLGMVVVAIISGIVNIILYFLGN